ncbi:hypothetical protein G6F24_018542 [Rhizopus arrhizus]|nr:hypothetical protein G6F24_018542 [Rhizopus arrhizus]
MQGGQADQALHSAGRHRVRQDFRKHVEVDGGDQAAVQPARDDRHQRQPIQSRQFTPARITACGSVCFRV